MARREVTQYYDDIDQTPLTEAELNVVQFSFMGTDYLLDLSSDNLRRFHEILTPFIAAAREVPQEGQEKVDPSEIREWAQREGLKIAHRGKIPFAIQDAYRQAHANTA